jgi:hypothetical protein
MPNWLLLIVIGAVLLVVAYYLARPDAPVHPSWVGWVCGLLGACALVVGVILAILAIIAIGNVVSAMGSASWLGISEIAWHWVLLAFATATALNTAFNRTPPITAPPTQPRLAVERQVHAIRKRAA